MSKTAHILEAIYFKMATIVNWLSKPQNGYDLIKFTDNELKPGLVAAESHPKQIQYFEYVLLSKIFGQSQVDGWRLRFRGTVLVWTTCLKLKLTLIFAFGSMKKKCYV